MDKDLKDKLDKLFAEEKPKKVDKKKNKKKKKKIITVNIGVYKGTKKGFKIYQTGKNKYVVIKKGKIRGGAFEDDPDILEFTNDEDFEKALEQEHTYLETGEKPEIKAIEPEVLKEKIEEKLETNEPQVHVVKKEEEEESSSDEEEKMPVVVIKRRGRPKGSKNKPKKSVASKKISIPKKRVPSKKQTEWMKFVKEVRKRPEMQGKSTGYVMKKASEMRKKCTC